jgi:hypothetical protein
MLTGTRDLSIPQPDAVPAVTLTPKAFRVSALPDDFPDGDMWTLHLEVRHDGVWVVRHRSAFLGLDGAWSYGFQWYRDGRAAEPETEVEMDDHNAAEDAWQAAHRFDLDTAIKLATEAAQTVTVMGKTAVQVWRASQQEAS